MGAGADGDCADGGSAGGGGDGGRGVTGGGGVGISLLQATLLVVVPSAVLVLGGAGCSV